MLNQGARALSMLFALSLVAVACGDDDDGDPTATGGTGAKTSGGATFGGGAGRGGGGATSGGTAGRGGATSGGATSGGTAGTGGSNTGGTTGGVDQGGAAGEGGSSGGNEGGSSGSGTGGVATGGNGPEGGSSGAGAGGMGEGGGGGAMGGAGGGDLGGAGAGGGGVVADMLDNPGFEANWTGEPWTVTGTGWKISESSSGGPRFLDLWAAGAYTMALSQVVSPLPDGNYTFAISYYGGPHATDSQVVYVKGYDHNNPTTTTPVSTPAAGNGAYATITVGPFAVTSASGTSGSVEVGVTTNAAAGEWSHFDDAVLTLVP